MYTCFCFFSKRVLTHVNPTSSISIEYGDYITKGSGAYPFWSTPTNVCGSCCYCQAIQFSYHGEAAKFKPWNGFSGYQQLYIFKQCRKTLQAFQNWIYLEPILPYIFRRCQPVLGSEANLLLQATPLKHPCHLQGASTRLLSPC